MSAVEGSAEATVLAALLADERARRRWRDLSDAWLAPVLVGEDPARAAALRILADGAWLGVALGLHPLRVPDLEPILRQLRRLICP